MKPSFWDWGLSEENPFFIRICEYPPGINCCNIQPDFHEAIHLNVLLEGDLNRENDSLKITSQLQITAPWEPHGETLRSKNGAKYCMTVISPSFLKKVLYPQGDKFFAFLSFPAEERKKMIIEYDLDRHAKIFAENIKRCGVEDTLYCWKAALNCFMDILHDLPHLEKRRAEENTFLRLLPALKKIGSGKGVTTAEEAALLCKMSVSRFRTLFKENFQKSFAAYELQHRLKGASEDIFHGRLTVKDAAWQWGFFDASHFSRLFKQTFGCTPGKYKDKTSPEK